MAVTVESDPVAQIISILENETGNWTDTYGDPDRIERAEDSQPSDKQANTRLTDVSLYVFSPVEGDREKFDAAGTIQQTEIVQVDIYTNDAARSNNYASDVVQFAQSYANDNQANTSWVDIFPATGVDNTAQGFYYGGYNVISEQVRLVDHNNPAGN